MVIPYYFILSFGFVVLILWIQSVLPGGHCGEFLIPQERGSSTTLFLSNKASRLHTNPRKGLLSFIELHSSEAKRSHFHFILVAQPQIHCLKQSNDLNPGQAPSERQALLHDRSRNE